MNETQDIINAIHELADRQKLSEITAAFAEVMYARLMQKYATKKVSYRDMPSEELANLLEDKFMQLDAALAIKADPMFMATLAADIANYAMMVASSYNKEKIENEQDKSK